MHRATQALRLIISTFLFPVCIAHGSARANVFLLVVVRKNVLHTHTFRSVLFRLLAKNTQNESLERGRETPPHTHTHTHIHAQRHR